MSRSSIPAGLTSNAVIYARFSSDSQSLHSIDDQVRICRARAGHERWEVIEIYADYAISGATVARPQFQALLSDARTGRFDIVLAESLDRLGRDQEHIAGFYKQVSFAGVRSVTIAEGEINELHVGLKGTMSALWLKDLAQKTHRGIEGRVRAGQSGGGLSFGYRVSRRFLPDGSIAAGEMGIIPEEAAIIRRVFTDYAGGISPRAIAKALNAVGVSGPRGGRWTASLILGNAVRQTGVLRNRLYAGERVWNRQRFIKDPATGKRVSRPNPQEAWIVTRVPALRIVDAELWNAVQTRLSACRRLVLAPANHSQNSSGHHATANRLGSARRPPWLLSGLVRCGVCGGPMGVVSSGGRLGCTNRRERGICTNARTLRREHLLQRVLEGLKHRLLAPELVETFVTEYVADVRAANRDRGRQQATLANECSRTAKQIRNLLELMKEGLGSAAMVQEMQLLERRQAELDALIAAAGVPEPQPEPHPNLPDLYRRRVEALEEALRDPSAAAVAAAALRTLIDAILVYPRAGRGQVQIELRGDLAAFLDIADPDRSKDTRTAVLLMVNGRSRRVMGSLVAGAGFEPAAFRL